MGKPEIAARLRLYLETEFPNQSTTLTDATNLLEQWFVDSLGLVQMIMFIETEFGIALARADINGENFENIASLSNLICGRLADHAGPAD